VHFPEALDRRVDRGYGTLGEAHDQYAVWVDARMMSKGRERLIGINHHRQRRKLGLVIHGIDDPSTRERIKSKSRDPDAVQLLYPSVERRSHSSRAMH